MSFTDKLDSMMIDAQQKMNNFAQDEKGDTNFISILVLLGIALALAGVFIGFKDQVLAWVNTNIGNFFSLSGGN